MQTSLQVCNKVCIVIIIDSHKVRSTADAMEREGGGNGEVKLVEIASEIGLVMTIQP